MFETRNTLAASIHGGLTPSEPNAGEVAQREKLKAALLDVIARIDHGEFAAAAITMVDPTKWPPEYSTVMYGEREIVAMAAAQIVRKYAGTHAKKEEEQAALTVESGEILAGG
jgi:hypothetical protein